MDTPLLSKIERGERGVKKELLNKVAKIFKTSKEELETLWMADQFLEVSKKIKFCF